MTYILDLANRVEMGDDFVDHASLIVTDIWDVLGEPDVDLIVKTLEGSLDTAKSLHNDILQNYSVLISMNALGNSTVHLDGLNTPSITGLANNTSVAWLSAMLRCMHID